MTRTTGRAVAWWSGRAVAWWSGLAVTIVAAAVVVAGVDAAALTGTLRAAAQDPTGIAVLVAVYLAAFVVRARAWTTVLPQLAPGHALAAIHLAAGANHVLPLRLGEALRVTSVVRRAGVPAAAAATSTVALRAADVTAVVAIGLVVGPGVAAGLLGRWWPLLLLGGLAAASAAAWWLVRLGRRHGGVRRPGPTTVVLTVCSWLLEAVVVWQVARWADAPIPVSAAVLVTAVTIAAQVAAVAPGGFGTYEAAATAALVAVGVDAGAALAVALTAHAGKTAYALVAGALGAVRPAPSLVGRLRLPRQRPTPPAPRSTPDDVRPVVLFLPAHDESATVARVVRRVPARVAGRRVRCLVVDDGSTDATARLAGEAGAEVVSLPSNQGLGAAVRCGLAEALARDAAVVAFCDADGEYAPEELERLVAPVLDGRADYVVGSRFAGDIQRMLPHRRLGNRVLTRFVRFVTRMPVTDGQSGYRALSATAAADARIVHDFNYAQVLTIDLLRKGYRYREVPISYRFREEGRSFVRLGRYLAAVVPGVWHSLNADLGGEPALEPPSAA